MLKERLRAINSIVVGQLGKIFCRWEFEPKRAVLSHQILNFCFIARYYQLRWCGAVRQNFLPMGVRTQACGFISSNFELLLYRTLLPTALVWVRLRGIPYQNKGRGTLSLCPCFGGDDGSRTHVRNLLIRLSPWSVCYFSFPLGDANKHASPLGSPFVLDRLKCEPPMQVHHSNDAQSAAVVLRRGTGDPQVTALPSFPSNDEKLRQP